MSEQNKRFVDAQEIIKDLGIDQRTLLTWIQKGRFPKPLRLGGRKRVWLRVELDDFYVTEYAKAQEPSESQKD